MQMASKYLFLIPILLLPLVFKQCIKELFCFYYKPITAAGLKKHREAGISTIPPFILKVLERVYRRNVLKYSDITASRLVLYKTIFFIASFCIMLLVMYTNIEVQCKNIINSMDYQAVMLDAAESFDRENEIALVKLCIKGFSSEMLYRNADVVRNEIQRYLTQSGLKFGVSQESAVNRVYTRLHEYYSLKSQRPFKIIYIAFLVSFMPEVLLLIRTIFAKSEAEQELRLLKKLVIINGSIKPVDFKEVLDTMIKHSKHYRRLLESIRDVNKQNSKDMEAVYASYIKASRSINEKLFLEKLDQANNYDFDQAVKNIENEFMMEKREVERNVKKRIELIHTIGITGMMLLIFVCLLYLIVPWIRLYNMSRLGI